jgi:hypothetical protein
MLAVISIVNLCFEDALIWVRVVEISNDRAVMRQRHDGTLLLSFPRRRESSSLGLKSKNWIPAFAGMTS